ncbi:UNVERIFIED_CONTAM: hypothetical protein K2H54_040537 [Gekko kuhli]
MCRVRDLGATKSSLARLLPSSLPLAGDLRRRGEGRPAGLRRAEFEPGALPSPGCKYQPPSHRSCQEEDGLQVPELLPRAEMVERGRQGQATRGPPRALLRKG